MTINKHGPTGLLESVVAADGVAANGNEEKPALEQTVYVRAAVGRDRSLESLKDPALDQISIRNRQWRTESNQFLPL